MRQKKENKLSPRFDPTEMTVTDIQGSSVEASTGGSKVFRDASFFRKIESEEEEDEYEQSNSNEEQRETIDETENVNEEPGIESDNTNGPATTSSPSVAASRQRRDTRAPARFGDNVM